MAAVPIKVGAGYIEVFPRLKNLDAFRAQVKRQLGDIGRTAGRTFGNELSKSVNKSTSALNLQAKGFTRVAKAAGDAQSAVDGTTRSFAAQDRIYRSGVRNVERGERRKAKAAEDAGKFTMRAYANINKAVAQFKKNSTGAFENDFRRMMDGVNRQSAMARRVSNEVGQSTRTMGQAFRQVEGNIDRSARSAGRLESALRRVAAQASNANNRTGAAFDSLGQSIRQVGNVTQSLGQSMTRFISLPIAGTLGFAAKAGLDLASALQRADKSFTAMLGSAELANKQLEDLKQFAVTTPFEMKGLITTAQMLNAVTKNGQQTNDIIKAFGNAAGVSGIEAEQFTGVMRQMSQMMMKGKVNAADMRVAIENGLPAWDIMAQATGKTTGELIQMSKAGTLMTADVMPKMVKYLQEDAKYKGQAAKASSTFTGALKNLSERVKLDLAEAFLANKEATDEAIDAFSNFATKALPAVKQAIAVVTPYVTRFFTFLGGLAEKFNSLDPAVRGMVIKFTLLAAAAGPLLTAFGLLSRVIGVVFQALGPFTRLLGPLVVRMGGFRNIIMTLLNPLKLFKSSMLGIRAAFAFITGPIGIAIGVILGIVFALKKAWDASEKFRNAVSTVFNQVKNILSDVGVALGGVFANLNSQTAGASGGFKSFGDTLAGALNQVSVWLAWISDNLIPIMSGLGAYMGMVAEIGGSILYGVFSALWEIIKSFGEIIFNTIGSMFDFGNQAKDTAGSMSSTTGETSGLAVALGNLAGVGQVIADVFKVAGAAIKVFGSLVAAAAKPMAALMKLSRGDMSGLKDLGDIKDSLGGITKAWDEFSKVGKIDVGASFNKGKGQFDEMWERVQADIERNRETRKLQQALAAADKKYPNKKKPQYGKPGKYKWGGTPPDKAAGAKAEKATKKAQDKAQKDAARQQKTAGTKAVRTQKSAATKAQRSQNAAERKRVSAQKKAAAELKRAQERMRAAQKTVGDSLVTFQRSLSGNAEQVEAAGARMAKSVRDAFDKIGKSKQGSRIVKALAADNKRLVILAKERDRILAKIKEAQEYAKGLTEGATSFGAIEVGDKGIDAKGVQGQLGTKVSALKAFIADIKNLAKRGLSKVLLRQIMDAGPAEGSKLAKALVAADDTTFRDINKLQAELDKQATALGKVGANSLFDSGAQAGKGFLSGLLSQAKQVETAMRKLAERAIKSVKKAFKIKSPSLVFDQIGRELTAGLVQGVEATLDTVGSASTALKNAAVDSAAPQAALTPQIPNPTPSLPATQADLAALNAAITAAMLQTELIYQTSGDLILANWGQDQTQLRTGTQVSMTLLDGQVVKPGMAAINLSTVTGMTMVTQSTQTGMNNVRDRVTVGWRQGNEVTAVGIQVINATASSGFATVASTTSARMATIVSVIQGAATQARTAWAGMVEDMNRATHNLVNGAYNQGIAGMVSAMATIGGVKASVPLVKFARGGRVNGEGYRDGVDTVPAMLTKGEYVLPKRAVDRIGADRLEHWRKAALSGGHMYAMGGLVTEGSKWVNDNKNNPYAGYAEAFGEGWKAVVDPALNYVKTFGGQHGGLGSADTAKGQPWVTGLLKKWDAWAGAGSGNAKAIVDLAHKQLGKGDRGGGDNNRNMYNDEFGWGGAPWCAIFMRWLVHHSKTYPAYPTAKKGDFRMANSWGGSGMKRITSGKDVQPGDIGQYYNPIHHVNMIVGKSGGTPITIGGNEGPLVKKNPRGGQTAMWRPLWDRMPNSGGGEVTGTDGKKHPNVKPWPGMQSDDGGTTSGGSLGGDPGGPGWSKSKIASFWDTGSDSSFGDTGAIAWQGHKMSKNTIAHRTLPFGTKVAFKYGGKTQIGVVGDRGPNSALADRAFDISTYMMAKFGLGFWDPKNPKGSGQGLANMSYKVLGGGGSMSDSGGAAKQFKPPPKKSYVKVNGKYLPVSEAWSQVGTGGGGAGGGGGGAGGGGSLPSGGNPKANRKLGKAMMLRKFGAAHWPALLNLWTRESGWNHKAKNRSSGAYGIPQSLPASKMRSAGPDYLNNPATQIKWGLGYIKNRYGTPKKAWAHFLRNNWYDKGAWDIPHNQVAAIHKGEMVVPARRAKTIREALKGKSGGPDQAAGLGVGGKKYDITINAAPNVPTERSLLKAMSYAETMYR